jgi:hypothetical protein
MASFQPEGPDLSARCSTRGLPWNLPVIEVADMLEDRSSPGAVLTRRGVLLAALDIGDKVVQRVGRSSGCQLLQVDSRERRGS